MIALSFAAVMMAAPPPEPVIAALRSELQRGVASLCVEGGSPVYAAALEWRRVEVAQATYALGAEVTRTRRIDHVVAAEVRVGSPWLDNVNFYSSWRLGTGADHVSWPLTGIDPGSAHFR